MRKLFCLLFFAVSLFLFAGAVSAEQTVVTSMQTECTIAEDGSCLYEMHATVEFEPGTEDFVIPVSTRARDLNLTGAKYRVERGSEYNRVVLLGTYSGPVELTVTYSLAETVTAVGNDQVFEINLLYPAWSCAIQGYSVLIHLPKPFETLPTILSGYYGDLIDNYMEITIQDGDLSAVLNSKQVLQDHEAMSLSLNLPGDYFDLRFLAGKTVRIDKLIFLVLLALSAVFWFVFVRGRIPLPKRQAMPPVGSNPGEIPLVLTDRKPDLALMLIHWASLGYLVIHRSRKGRVWLTMQIDMGNERKPYEIETFRTLFHRGDTCDLRSREFSKAAELAVSQTTSYWRKRVFGKGWGTTLLRLLTAAAGAALCLACFDLLIPPKSWRWFAILPLSALGGLACWLVQSLGGSLLRRHSVRTILLGLGGLLFLLLVGRRSGIGKLMLLCMAAQAVVGFLVRCGGRRTRTGYSLATELLGYRRWLLSTNSAAFQTSLEADPQFFYRSLPYADALRVSKLFAGSFEGLHLEACDWLDWEGKPVRSARGFYVRYERLMRALRGEREPLLARLRRFRRTGRPATAGGSGRRRR